MQKDNKPSSSSSGNMSQSALNTFDEAIKMFIDLCQEMIVISSIGLVELGKLSVRHFPWSAGLAYAVFVLTETIIFGKHHLSFLYKSEPLLFTAERLNWTLKLPLIYHQVILICFILFFVCFALGVKRRYLRSKFIRIFNTAGLRNGTGDTPKLVYQERLDKYRVRFDFDANGVGISEFQDKKERIQALFQMEIESIKEGKHPGRVLVTFNTRSLSTSIPYQDISEEKVLPPDSFYVGQSSEGVVTQKIADLPHMIIAGTTGSGKSNFFKQCLLGLLDSTKHLQLIVIDLKGGLEAVDFKEAPNVKIVKKMNEAVDVLRLVDKEMSNRFNFLEANSLKSIVPERDKKDRIIVAVDEASILYQNRSRYDDDYKIGLEARKLADSISKLSRAAAIHLILATQKLDKEVIPTSVSENISGRMAFRSPSLQGSMVVLGTKDAMDLPAIKGRGIWNVGNEMTIVQAPFITDAEIKRISKRISNEFKANERITFEPLIGQPVPIQSTDQDEAVNTMEPKDSTNDKVKKQNRSDRKRH